MSFSFGICHLPNNKALLSSIRSGCERLEKKLLAIDFNSLDITKYNKRYILQMIGTTDGLTNTLRKYAFVLSWALHKEKNFKETTFLDYGAGHGLLSMLAAEIGINNCIISDIFAPSIDDAKALSLALDLRISHFITGDMDQTIEYLRINNISIDVISNYDTIEHIYDIKDFLSKLNALGEKPTYFFASGANGSNPFIRKQLIKDHIFLENNDKTVQAGLKDSDPLFAHKTLRKNIIIKYFNDLSQDEVSELVRVTRGKREDDIITITQEYLNTKTLPAEISEPTDTCDPVTGNWAEHIMDPYELNLYLEQVGFKNTFVIAGYYGKPKKFIKKVAGFIFNIYTRMMPTKLGLKLAPFYAIYGNKLT